jgi:hypothetical protein
MSKSLWYGLVLGFVSFIPLTAGAQLGRERTNRLDGPTAVQPVAFAYEEYTYRPGTRRETKGWEIVVREGRETLARLRCGGLTTHIATESEARRVAQATCRRARIKHSYYHLSGAGLLVSTGLETPCVQVIHRDRGLSADAAKQLTRRLIKAFKRHCARAPEASRPGGSGPGSESSDSAR